MEANAGMVAGSYNRNELVTIRHDGEGRSKPLKNVDSQLCEICSDSVGFSATGDIFVACNECGYPVCRPCYEYERKDGNKCCPQCKTRYKRHKGSPRVEGDEDEDDVDDIDNEFNHTQGHQRTSRPWQVQNHVVDNELSFSSRHDSQSLIPRLTSGQMLSGEIPDPTPDRQSVRSSGPMVAGENRAQSYVDPSMPVPVRTVDPTRDLNSYGLGNVDWKERVEGWKLKQENNMQMTTKYAEGKTDIEGTGSNGEDLQIIDDARQPLNRIVPLPSNQLNIYRVVVILRLMPCG